MIEDLIFCGDLRFFKNEKERCLNRCRFVGVLVSFDGDSFSVDDTVKRFRINELSGISEECFYVYDANPQRVVKLLLEAGVNLKRIRVAEFHENAEDFSYESDVSRTDERVFVFGAGAYGEGFIKRFKHCCHIIGILDNDPTKWGSNILGVDVLNPENVSNFEWDRVVICSQFWREIDAQLKSDFGVDSSQIEVWAISHDSNTGGIK